MRKIGLFGLLALIWGSVPAETGAQDPATISRFHDAVQQGEVATVRDMLQHDPALATSTGPFGFAPMQLQDLYFDPEILNLLLANGADINRGNDEAVTLLHIITEPDAVPLLIRKGADIEARDIRGWTPLIMQVTSQENGPDMVRALLEAGANATATGLKGETALSLALEGGANTELVALLKSAQRN